MDSETLLQSLYCGLEFMRASAFPKKCRSCGRVYETSGDFFTQTQSLSGKSGLKQSMDYNERALVELFRNCVCGSTLMEEFRDRRDTSELGLRRRERFGQLLELLINSGIEASVGRQELLKALRGEKSEILQNIGLSPEIK